MSSNIFNPFCFDVIISIAQITLHHATEDRLNLSSDPNQKDIDGIVDKHYFVISFVEKNWDYRYIELRDYIVKGYVGLSYLFGQIGKPNECYYMMKIGTKYIKEITGKDPSDGWLEELANLKNKCEKDYDEKLLDEFDETKKNSQEQKKCLNRL